MRSNRVCESNGNFISTKSALKVKVRNVPVACSRWMYLPPFVYQCVLELDLVGHTGMIAALEETFNIMMDTDDIIEFSSCTVGIEKLRKYEGVI